MIHRENDGNPTTPDMLARSCFLCGRALTDECISWAGETATIAMHIPCAGDLVLRLGRDVWQYRNELPKPH